MAEHTKGILSVAPLDVGRGVVRYALYSAGARYELATLGTREDACRLAACWNACEGMADPAAEIAALRVDLALVTEALKEAAEDEPFWGPASEAAARLTDAQSARKLK